MTIKFGLKEEKYICGHEKYTCHPGCPFLQGYLCITETDIKELEKRKRSL